MSTKRFNVEFEEGTEVWFTFDSSTTYVVRGYEVRKDLVIYIVFNPEVGEVNALVDEITNQRPLY